MKRIRKFRSAFRSAVISRKSSPSVDGLLFSLDIHMFFITRSVRNASAILTRSGTMNGNTHMPSAEA